MPTLSELPPASSDRTGWPWTTAPDPLPETQPDGSPWPSISIVTPSYNQGAYIEETIRSVLLQGYPNLEYVVMDGGSTDETAAILETYDAWITHWESKPDDGQADAINQGVQRCTGQIFNWINSDDILHPGALATLARGFVDTPDAVAGPVINFSESTERLVVNRGLKPKYMLASSKHSKFHQPGVWLRRPLLKTVLPFRSDLRYCFDTELYVRYLKRYPNVTYVDTPLVHFRLHDASKSVGEKSGLDREFYHLKRSLMRDGFSEARAVYHREVEAKTWHRVVNLIIRSTSGSRLACALKLLGLLLTKEYGRIDRFFVGSLVRRVLLSGS